MERVEDKQSAQGHKGLQQRRSYMSLSEQEQAGVLQAVDMRRTGSNQSTSSQKTESSIMKDSSEDQIPGQPINFGMVVPGVYRSSYPMVADYPFLQQLKLKTIITLVDKEMPETFAPFMRDNGIRHCVIAMEGTKKSAISPQTISTILELVHDRRNHPILIHCNQGRHRTGCAVAITRKLQQWNTERILDEYKAYAAPKIRNDDVKYISNFQASEVEHLGLVPLAEMPSTCPFQSVRNRCHLYLAAAIMILMFISLNDIMQQPESNMQRNPSLGS